MAITTYLELKTAIQDWSKRTDATSMLDTFIDLAESDMWQRLRIRDMEARATATPSSAYLALPDGFLEMRKLRLYSGSVSYELECVTPESMDSLTSSGVPEHYSITSQLEFNRPPTSATAEMHYYRSLTALSASNTSNAVLSRFPMIYLYGALFHLNQWAINNEGILQYGTLFERAINDANKHDRKARYGAAKAMKFDGRVA